MTNRKFLDLSRNIHGYKYNYIDLPEKLSYKDYIKVEFLGSIYTQRVNKHLEGKCPEKNTPKKTTEEFIKESKELWGDRFIYDETEYISALKKVKIFDTKSGILIEQTPSAHLQGYSSKKINNDDFINQSKLVSDYRYSYNNCVYINKTTKVELICKDHGNFLITPFNHLNYGDCCKKCKFYIFNKMVKKYLNDNRVIYKQQYKPSNFEIPFDFYIGSLLTLIDFTYNDESLKTNDKIKSDYCEENFINLIRIKYTDIDNIDKILYENLKVFMKSKNNI